MKWNNILRIGMLSLILAGCSPYQEKQTQKLEKKDTNRRIKSIYNNVINNSLIPEVTEKSEIKKHKIMHFQSSNKVYEIQVFETKHNVQEILITHGYSKKEMLSFRDTEVDGILDKAYIYNPLNKENYSENSVAVTYSVSPIPASEEYQKKYSSLINELSDLLERKN